MEHGLLLQHMSTILKLCKQNNPHENELFFQIDHKCYKYRMYMYVVPEIGCNVCFSEDKYRLDICSARNSPWRTWNGETNEDELDRFKVIINN